jgi:hypothetical protein
MQIFASFCDVADVSRVTHSGRGNETRFEFSTIQKNETDDEPSRFTFLAVTSSIDNDAPPSPSWDGIPSLSVVATLKVRSDRLCTTIVMDIESTAYDSGQRCGQK